MSDIRIELDQTDCCGSKMCENIAPGAFKLVGDGYAVVVDGAEMCPLDILKKAARSCPTQCIVLYEGDTEIDIF